MKTYKFLVLTDQRGHSAENSIYALLATLARHPQCQSIYVADRGQEANRAFYQGEISSTLQAKPVDASLVFKPDRSSFSDDLIPVGIDEVDVVLLRLPRPVSDDFLEKLNKYAKHKVLINHPNGILKTSNKAFLLEVEQWCPPVKLCFSVDDVLSFARQFPAVLKPLKEYGGKGIIRISGDEVHTGQEKHQALPFLESIRSTLENEGMLAMKFLKNVDQGDKRILVVGGEIQGASLRLPPKGSWICNVAQGGSSVPAEPTEKEIQMIKAIAPVLNREGILIFGADTLVDDEGNRVLSEINTLSIGGFPQAEAQSGKPVLKQTIDLLIKYINDNIQS